MRHIDQRKHSGMRVLGPQKLHVSMYKNAQKKLQLIIAGVQRFLLHICAAQFRLTYTRKTPCALHVYTQTEISTFFEHRNGDTPACLTQG